jgi:hypothetical protein
MSYARPSHRTVAGVHYKPMWNTAEAEKPAVKTVKSQQISEAFPGLTYFEAGRLSFLFNAQGAVVPFERISLEIGVQNKAISGIRKQGIEVLSVKERGYCLSPAALEFVRRKLEEVQG